MFALKHVDIGYREKNSDVILFEKLNLSIEAGEMVCLMGPNGIGKSTLIRSVAHLQPLIKGEVWLHDEPLHNANPEQIASCLSLVLTEKVNTLNIKTEEMIGYGRYPYLNWKLAFSDEDYTIINKAIQQTHIEHLKGKKMYELSDGQAQLVMIARALVQDGDVILLDEPTAHLDLNNRVEIMNLLKTLARQTGKAILVATHELDLALQTADTIWLAGLDKTIKTGAPEDLVLDGSIDEVFKFKGYDLKTGKVFHKPERNISIAVQGSGHTLLWTKNALERCGYAVDSSGTATIEIIQKESQITWILKLNEQTTSFTQLEHLLKSLNELQ